METIAKGLVGQEEAKTTLSSRLSGMKYRPELSKVHALIHERFHKLYQSKQATVWSGLGANSSWADLIDKEWTLICSEIGIDRVGIDIIEGELMQVGKNNNIIFEDPYVSLRWSVPNPNGIPKCGGWLLISEETALKILVLGMP